MNKVIFTPREPRGPSAPATPAKGFALWNLGFRPFYLLASVFAALSVPLWAAQFSGILPAAYLQSSVWHCHGMLFSYTTAVIAGFLLTAVRAWTNQLTPSGLPLMALAALWVCGRVLVLTPFATAALVVNVTFPIAVATALSVPLLKSKNVRNYFFLGLLALLGVLTVVVQQALSASPQLGLQLALDVVLFILVVMGGRVIPMFTNNGIPGTQAIRKPLLEKFALGAILLLFIADLLQWPAAVVAGGALLGAAVHAARLWLWQPWRTRATPLVWVLHAAYAWIVIHLALRGLTALDVIGGSYAAHALTVGAIGGMTLGMMTRTSRGHTGRPLVADRFELAMFSLIHIAAMIRVFAGLITPQLYLPGILISSLLWSLAFGLYAVRYWPVLTRPRLDGKPG